MKKFSLLLLDANVVIEISRQGIWSQVVSRCEIQLAQTVLDEAQFYDDDEGERHYIDLSPHIAANAIKVVSLAPSQLGSFLAQFDPVYLEKMDAGETESLAYLLEQSNQCRICSADKITYRVLGSLGRSDQGVSLEEVLGKIGLGRRLAREFTREYREQWTRKGFDEGLTGLGRRPTK